MGSVMAYDRRGYARSGGEPVRSMSTHTADAAALLEYLRTPPAVVVGTSAGAAIAVDLAAASVGGQTGAGGRPLRFSEPLFEVRLLGPARAIRGPALPGRRRTRPLRHRMPGR